VRSGLKLRAAGQRHAHLTPEALVSDADQGAGALFGLAIGTNAAGQQVLYYGNSDTNTLHELVLQGHYR
jgi:hypothetical protein